MTIYVDWENQEVKTFKELEEEIIDIIEDESLHAEYLTFNEYLSVYYSSSEIFEFSEEKKSLVFDLYMDELRSFVEDTVFDRYEAIEVENNV